MEIPTAKNFEDLTGQVFHYLTVKKYGGVKNRHRHWWCECKCGKCCVLRSANTLKSGNTKSCGCLRTENSYISNKTHGMSYSRVYKIWRGICDRCENSNGDNYERYGARGIKVCERWKKFENFYADMGPRPSKKHSIDRKDNDGDYCPENCRWATRTEQQNNLRTNVRYECRGKMLTIGEMAREFGLTYNQLFTRIKTLNWSVERSITTPVAKTRPRKNNGF